MEGNTLGVIVGLISLCGSIATPIVWGGKVTAVNDVQDVRISNTEVAQKEIRSDLKELSNKVDALLIINGVNPNSIKK